MKIQQLTFIALLILIGFLLSGCDEDNGIKEEGNGFGLFFGGKDLFKGLFNKTSQELKSEKVEDVTTSLYSDYDHSEVNKKLNQNFDKYGVKLEGYNNLVDNLWSSGNFYKLSDEKISPKETLIDFYLFLEYHKDTQARNITFPSPLNEELLKVEMSFLKRAIKYVESLSFKGEYEILRKDLLVYSKRLLNEELVNTLNGDKVTVIVNQRLPNVLERSNAELLQSGLYDRIRLVLGIPHSVISRGMGLDVVSLYSGLGDYTKEDVRTLAIILTIEMRISGTNLKLEQFLNAQSNLNEIDADLETLKDDVKIINLTGELSWVKDRMIRCIDYLEDVRDFYRNNQNNVQLKDLFVELQVREDFYALNLLNSSLKEVMDNEDYWDTVEDIKVYLKTRDKEEEELVEFNK